MAGRKPMTRAIGDLFTGRKVKVIMPLNTVTENQPYLRNGKACKLPFEGQADRAMEAWLQATQLVLCTICNFCLNSMQDTFYPLISHHTVYIHLIILISHFCPMQCPFIFSSVIMSHFHVNMQICVYIASQIISWPSQCQSVADINI